MHREGVLSHSLEGRTMFLCACVERGINMHNWIVCHTVEDDTWQQQNRRLRLRATL